MKVNRTGNRPLQFEGETLATGSSSTHSGATSSRWHEVQLYQTNSGQYVCSIGYRTQWQGESEYDEAESFAEIDGVVSMLRGYDPTQYLIGYPPGNLTYDQKQDRIKKELRIKWEELVAEVLSEFPEEI